MSHIRNSLRALVRQRAQNRCEYCQLAQDGQAATFHVDHIIPIKSGGETTSDNLALACVSCSLHKAAKETAPDPETGAITTIYNPRLDNWHDHFAWDEVRVIGLTATGRVTIAALKMNRPLILEIRREEILFGRHP